MLGFLLRLAFFAVALVGLVLLFFYAAVVALIFIPVVLILAFFLRRHGVVRWTTVDLRKAYGTSGARASHAPHGRPTVIDHDPNDVTIDRENETR
jgi:hypothetical protein